MRVTYVALLRGINVGGKNKIPMSDLRSLYVEAGCGDVQTYIQSGNVVFKAAHRPGIASGLITARIAEHSAIVWRS